MQRRIGGVRTWLTVSVVLATAGSALGQGTGPTISRNPGQMVAAGFARAQAAADAARAIRPVTEQPREVFGWGDRSIEIIRDQLVDLTAYFMELLMNRAGLGDLLNFEFDFDGNGVTGTGNTNSDTTVADVTNNTSTGAVKQIERTPGRLTSLLDDRVGINRGRSGVRRE